MRIFTKPRGTWICVTRVGLRNLAFYVRLEMEAVICFQLFAVISNNLAVD